MDNQTKLLSQIETDTHAVAAPVRFVGRLVITMAMTCLLILLFPAIILAILFCWHGFAASLGTDPSNWGIAEFLLWFFGSFAGTFWLYFVAHIAAEDGVLPSGRAATSGLVVLAYVFGAVASFAEPSPATFVRMLVALMLPGALFVLYAATAKSKNQLLVSAAIVSIAFVAAMTLGAWLIHAYRRDRAAERAEYAAAHAEDQAQMALQDKVGDRQDAENGVVQACAHYADPRDADDTSLVWDFTTKACKAAMKEAVPVLCGFGAPSTDEISAQGIFASDLPDGWYKNNCR